MFCPRCGTENDSGQGYCRRCGLSLPAVALALEGRIDEALGKLGRGVGSLSAGVVVIACGLLNALVNGYFAAWQSAVVSAAVGSAVGVPLIAAGLARVARAKRLLNPAEESGRGTRAGESGREELPEAHTKILSQGRAEPGSVTEHTTLELEPSGPAGRK